MTEQLLEKLAADCPARLKWLVCRRLGIAPGSLAWRAMSARRVLKYACHLALDERGGTSVRSAAEPDSENGEFDLKRFEALSRGGGL